MTVTTVREAPTDDAPQATAPSFNLVDLPWIPMVARPLASLREVFEPGSGPGQLGGNPVQKAALMKLLLAIAQAAATPNDDEAWRKMGPDGMSRSVLSYLDLWHSRFDLYGPYPFLQMPAISNARTIPASALSPEFASGNTTVLTQTQMPRALSQAELALLLVVLSPFALSGKKTDNSVVLSPGYQGKVNEKGKPSSGKTSPGVAYLGLLHSFLMGESVGETVWMNLLTEQDIRGLAAVFPQGLGRAPWEQMPIGEDCPVAGQLRQSIMGRLVPLSRFCLIATQPTQVLHYSEGISHPSYKAGVCDPSASMGLFGKKAEPKVLWCNPERRPWRELVSLLGVLRQSASQGMGCRQVDLALPRVRNARAVFSLWSGGCRVRSNAGEQFFGGTDDFVESVVQLDSAALGQLWFQRFAASMTELDALSSRLYGAVLGYFKEQNKDGAAEASTATHLFWQLAERHAQDLIEASDASREEDMSGLRKKFAACAWTAFDAQCANETARQMQAWSKCRPNLGKYISQGVVK